MRALEWTPVASPPPLSADTVHVWRMATLSSGGDDDAALLSEGERERAARLRRPAERARFIAGRAAVRRILGSYTGEDARSVVFGYGPFGKPFLPEGAGERFRFSVTHAGDLLMVAVTHGRDVGVDVELVREVRRRERIAERHFAPEVCAVLAGIEPARAGLGFLHAWTCLEAYAKARGGGVYATCTHLPLPWPVPAEGVVVQEAGPGAEALPWTLRMVHPADGFVAAVVAAGRVDGFVFLEGPPARD